MIKVSCKHDATTDEWAVTTVINGDEKVHYFDDKPAAVEFVTDFMIEYLEETIDGVTIEQCPPEI